MRSFRITSIYLPLKKKCRKQKKKKNKHRAPLMFTHTARKIMSKQNEVGTILRSSSAQELPPNPPVSPPENVLAGTRYRTPRCVSHTPLGRFSKLNFSATKRAPMPNDTSSESSRVDVSKADLFDTDTIPTAGMSTMENRPRTLTNLFPLNWSHMFTSIGTHLQTYFI